MGFPGGSVIKLANAGATGDTSSMSGSWVGKIPWRTAWQPTSAFLPGESHGQRSLVGYSPQARKESDTTEQLSRHAKEKQRLTSVR